jgi:hypothetical protein
MDAPGGDADVTSEMPLATVTELDVTAQLPTEDGEARDADASGKSAEHTAEFALDDQTVEMPANDSDVTAELPAESGKVDTKAS